VEKAHHEIPPVIGCSYDTLI